MPCLPLEYKSLEGTDGICLAFVCLRLKHSAQLVVDILYITYLIHQTFAGHLKNPERHHSL